MAHDLRPIHAEARQVLSQAVRVSQAKFNKMRESLTRLDRTANEHGPLAHRSQLRFVRPAPWLQLEKLMTG